MVLPDHKADQSVQSGNWNWLYLLAALTSVRNAVGSNAVKNDHLATNLSAKVGSRDKAFHGWSLHSEATTFIPHLGA